ncbi:hypothetical protein IDG68_14970, partial [Staphylococcus sp. EG-SA-21]|nr:hypothetical protein [Staphylococcus sp. EG-SA-21]
SGQTPHIHFDIAGPATTNKASYNGPKGPTGFMIPTIVQWLKQEVWYTCITYMIMLAINI